MLIKKYKSLANKTLDKHIQESLADISLFSNFNGFSFCLSAHGLPTFFCEDKEDTILLDMDETLLHARELSPELLSFLQENPTAHNIQPDKSSLKDSAEVKKWSLEHVEEFQKAISNHQYKDKLHIVKHPLLGYELLILRPHIPEFIKGLEKLIQNENLKDVKVYTSNGNQWAQTMVDTINKQASSQLKLYDAEALTPNSKLVDDQKSLAKLKLWKSKIIADINQDISNAWIPIDLFRGDMNDKALLEVLSKIQQIK